MGEGEPSSVLWRSDLDALQFDLHDAVGGATQCLVHRLAFRALLSLPATPDACQAYFSANRAAFEAAARVKAERSVLLGGARFHLTSRDIAKAIGLSREADPSVD